MLEAARIEAAEAQVASATETAVDALASVFDWQRFLSSRLVDRQDELVDACRIVGDRAGHHDPRSPRPRTWLRTDPLTAIARASKIRFRRVGLSADWWRREGEPLVGELVDGGHVALLPRRRRRGYELMDPASGRSTTVSETEARPAPTGRHRHGPSAARTRDQLPVAVRVLAARGAPGRRPNPGVRHPPRAARAGPAAGHPARCSARSSRKATYGRLLALVAGLVGVAIAASLFEIARGIALLRTRVRVGNALQMALWDRMLRLPASFFRRYQVGDLAERSLVVNAVNEQVTDVVVLSLIGGVFGLFNLVAMIIISPPLAVVGLLLCAVGRSRRCS